MSERLPSWPPGLRAETEAWADNSGSSGITPLIQRCVCVCVECVCPAQHSLIWGACRGSLICKWVDLWPCTTHSCSHLHTRTQPLPWMSVRVPSSSSQRWPSLALIPLFSLANSGQGTVYMSLEGPRIYVTCTSGGYESVTVLKSKNCVDYVLFVFSVPFWHELKSKLTIHSDIYYTTKQLNATRYVLFNIWTVFQKHVTDRFVMLNACIKPCRVIAHGRINQAKIRYCCERPRSQNYEAVVTQKRLNAGEDMRGASSVGTKNTRKISALEDSSEKEAIKGKSVFSQSCHFKV